jgi:hypothetical protein
MTSRPRAALAAAGLAALAAPATAQAADIGLPACQRVAPELAGQRIMPVQGTGFTPGSIVRVSDAQGNALGSVVADPAGNFQDTILGPLLGTNETRKTVQINAVDQAGVASAPKPLNVVKITATMPDRARPRSRVRIRAYGFQTGKTVYLHIRRGGKTRGSFKISRANGDCGIASRRMRYMPLRRFSSGTYDYYFQQSRRFSRKQPGVRLRIRITREVRFR